MLSYTPVMVIKIIYVWDTEQQSQRGVLIANTADGVPSISSFFGLIHDIATLR